MIMKKIVNTLIYGLILIGIIFTVVLLIRRQKPCPPEGYVLVEIAWVDSLQKIAEITPEKITDTVERIKIVKEPIPTPVPVVSPPEIGIDTTEYRDTLRTEHFNVFLYDRFYNNRLQKRAFDYEVFIPEKIVTTTITQTIPMPYAVDVRKRLYGAINVGGINSIDLSLRMRDRNDMIGLGFGYSYKGDRLIYARYQFPIF